MNANYFLLFYLKNYININCDKIRCFYFSILCIINSETLPVNCEKNWYHKHIYVHIYSLVKKTIFHKLVFMDQIIEIILNFLWCYIKKLRFEFKSLNQRIYIYIYIYTLTLDEISTIIFIKNKLKCLLYD